MNITGLCETRWSGEGVFEKEGHTIIFSGNKKGGNHGVAIILDSYHGKCLRSHDFISDRIVTIKLNSKTAPINIIQVYAPTSDCDDEEIEKISTMTFKASKTGFPAEKCALLWVTSMRK